MVPLLMSRPQRRGSRQWERLVETLQCAGNVHIEEIASVAEEPQHAFTAPTALISDGLAVLSSTGPTNLQYRRDAQRPALARRGFALTFLTQTPFAGASDALFDRVRPLLYVGYGFATERAAALQLSDLLGVRSVPLLLVDERFAHLDTALCPLRSGHVIVYMDAFSPRSQQLLRRAVEPEYLLEIGREDALDFACNALELDGTIVVHEASFALRRRLNDAGYSVFATDLDDFVSAGGSAKSLALRLSDGPARSVEAA